MVIINQQEFWARVVTPILYHPSARTARPNAVGTGLFFISSPLGAPWAEERLKGGGALGVGLARGELGGVERLGAPRVERDDADAPGAQAPRWPTGQSSLPFGA